MVNILLVDDHLANLVALESVLGDLRQNLVTARSGREAIRRLLEGQFAVILLDVQMPDMDGFETAALIRERECSRHTPIIFLTAIDKSATHVARGYSLGAVDYLFKPFQPGVLRAKVAAFVELAENQRRLQEEVRRRESAEEALRELNGSLEQRIRRRTAELEAANRDLAQADRAKDDFLAMLAHELRNPLAPIRSAIQLLKRIGAPNPQVTRACEIIDRQATHQARLIDDLLDVSRITRGKITLRPQTMDLARVVRDAALDCFAVLEETGLHLELHVPEDPIWIEGDPTRIAQVVGNLLCNAFKFSEPDGRIELTLTTNEQRTTNNDADSRLVVGRWSLVAGEARITVRDFGIGIEPELLPHVFETFTQADRSLDRSRGGLGLGLALVKGLVEQHGGTVTAHSDGPGCGSTFAVTLPVVASLPGCRVSGVGCRQEDRPASRLTVARRLSPTPDTRHPTPSLTVLLIEDNPDAAQSLRDLLELEGYRVTVVDSGPAALDEARHSAPEVVICDIGLPGMDGYQVAAALRRDEATAGARLIAVSGYGRDEDRLRSREAGFDAHLTKPVDFAVLEGILKDRKGDRVTR